MIRKFILIACMFLLSGCSHWNQLSEGEKVSIVVGTAVIVGAVIIKNGVSNDINKICISTRSIQTGCGDARL